MDLTDARTRKKVTLNPRTVLFSNSWVSTTTFISPAHDNGNAIFHIHRVSGTRRHRYLFSNALLVVALWTIKEWLFIPETSARSGSYAHPRVRCPRSGSKRGGVGRCTEGAGGCVVGEGTHFSLSFSFSVLLNGCGRL